WRAAPCRRHDGRRNRHRVRLARTRCGWTRRAAWNILVGSERQRRGDRSWHPRACRASRRSHASSPPRNPKTGGGHMLTLIPVLVLVALAIVVIARTATVVPQQSAFVVERLGKYSKTLHAGFHILVPFVERIAYRHSLKEAAVDIPEQICITRDNVQVHVDGVLYLKILNAELASYGISNYHFAISQLAQTTLRSEVGKIDLDRTFEERGQINHQVVTELDKASEPWGVKVLRYEIKNITPPQ